MTTIEVFDLGGERKGASTVWPGHDFVEGALKRVAKGSPQYPKRRPDHLETLNAQAILFKDVK